MKSTRSSRRQRAFFAQLHVELFLNDGEPERAFTALASATDEGLFDEAWIDGCPALAPLRRDPRFTRAREAVAERAAAAVAALLPNHAPRP